MIVTSPSKNSNSVPEKKTKSPGDDSSCIPLPIQSFLWRQTNPFLGSKVGKLHEASCVTFERVVVQNILHGLSPSLSDAIASIPRWRFVRAAFPHVVQCCSALLNERQKNEDEGRLSQSLSKMLYILHWMVFDSASECSDSDQSGGDEMLNTYLFPLNCIQIFIYLVAPLAHTLKEADITGNRRLENGLALWQSLWENRQPDILCFAAPVKPKKSQLMCVPLLKKTLQTTAAQDIYMGGGIYLGDEESPKRTRQRSMAQIAPFRPADEKQLPPESARSYQPPQGPPTGAAAAPSTSVQVTSAGSPGSPVAPPPKTVVATPTPSSTAGAQSNVTTTTGVGAQGTPSVADVSPIKPPQRSVSAYHKKFSEPSKSTTAPHPTSGPLESSVTYENLARTASDGEGGGGVLKLDELARHLKYVEEGSSGAVEISDRAPLVQLRDICGPAWPSLDLPSTPSTHYDVLCEVCQTVIYRDGNFLGACQCGRAVQQLRVVSSSSVASSSIDERMSLGGMSTGLPAVPPSVPPPDTSSPSPTGSATLPSPTQPPMKLLDTLGRLASPDKLSPVLPDVGTPLTPGMAVTPVSTVTTSISFTRREKPDTLPTMAATSITLSEKQLSIGTGDGSTPVTQAFGGTTAHATYMDVAVLRCLSIRHWPEEGVFWGLRYIYQRLLDVTLEHAQKTFFRKRSSSVPIPKLKVTFATLSQPQAHQSKTDLDIVDNADSKRPPTWENLKPGLEMGKLKRRSSSKTRVAFFVDDETKRGERKDELGLPKESSLERRRSLSSIKQMFVAKGIVDKSAIEGAGGGSEDRISVRQCDSGVSTPAIPYAKFNATSGPGGSLGSLARSATDSNISYIAEYLGEAVGSAPYIHKNGHLNLKVVLQVISNVAERHLSLRVCETVLNIMDIMLDSEMFHRLKKPVISPAGTASNTSPSSGGGPTATSTAVSKKESAASAGDLLSLSAQQKEKEKPKNVGGTPNKDGPEEGLEIELTDLFMNSMTKILFVLGCQHGCSDGVRSPQADFLRSQCRNCLSRLFRHDKYRFVHCIREFVTTSEMSRVVDFFHAFTGFCSDPASGNRLRSVSRSSQEQQNKPRTENQQQPSYKNKFLVTQKGIEGIMMMASLKLFVSRLESSMEELKQPENTGLHQDVRAFMTFAQENHGHAFRIVELSALIDAVQKPRPSGSEQGQSAASMITVDDGYDGPHHQQENDEETQSGVKAKKPETLTLPAITVFDTGTEKSSGSANESDSESSRNASPGFGPGKEQNAAKRRFFKRQRDKLDESDADSSSPGTPRHRLSTEETPTGSSSSPLLPGMIGGKKKTSKLQMALSILKSVRSENHGGSAGTFDETDASDTEADRSQEDLSGDLEAKKSKRKISFKSAAKSLSIISKVRRRKTLDNTSEDGAEGGAVKTKLVIEQLNIPSKTLVNILAIREGSRRFAFMLETCKPGSVPDAPLLGALLDLNAPVLARSMIFIECCHFVHRCNKGQWPEWIRAVPVGRASTAPLGRGTPSGLRRANLLQRAAGKLFYQWGEAVATRLEEIMQREKVNAESMVRLPTDELARQQLRVNDDLEDFLDEAVVNPTGEECPFALKLLACMLLYEITAFLRETFQSLPRSRSHSRLPTNWDKLMSHRRWSVLSATFNPSQQSGSIQSIADLVTILHPAVGERRISFCAQDEEESLNSSHSTIDEGTTGGDKRTRRLAQGRQRLLKRGGGGSQHIRRSVKQKRSKEKRDDDEAPGGGGVAAMPIFNELRRKSLRLMRSLTSGSSAEQHSSDAGGDLAHRESVKSRKQSTFSDEPSYGENDESPDRSDTEGPVGPPGIGGAGMHPQAQVPPRRSSDSPADAASAATQQSDQEDASYSRHMPWLKTVVHLGNMFNFVCTHQKYCHPFCYQRCYRQCHRMMVSLRKVYGESFSLEGQLDRRRQLLDSLCQRDRDRSSNERRRTSALSTIRRESAMVRGGPVDKGSAMHLKNLLLERLDTEEGKEKDKETKSKDKRVPEIEKPPEPRKPVVESPILKYIKSQVFNPTHSPLSTFLKAALIANDAYFLDILPVAWELLLESDVNVVSCAAAAFITCSVKQAEHSVEIMKSQLTHKDASVRICAVTRFYTLWRHRYHCWLKLEDGAHVSFKVPPPGIDFTLPSPPIGLPQVVVVDPPWMPHKKAKIQELTLKEEEDTTKQTIMTMTKTRRKQKQEILKRAIQQAEERKSSERRQHFFLATPVQQQAAYEPSLFATSQKEAAAGMGGAGAAGGGGGGGVEDEEPEGHPTKIQVPVAQPLFPSCLCIAAPLLVEMLDDSEVNADGVAVSEVAKKVVWSCIVEDCALFIRHFLEKLTSKDKQEELLGLLRKLLLQFGALPPQTAYTLVNYLIGFVMYYVRSPVEGSQEAIGIALSLLWLVIPHLQGLYFKDAKQTLRKEQCDAAILITANVPSAKKIVVHGPDQTSIPSQFPVHEDTQFQQIFSDSIEFFNIPEDQASSHFLIDSKTGLMHGLGAYVRDFYFFRRSFYPQLNLVQLNPNEALPKLKQMARILKFAEVGKVLLSYNVLKTSPDQIVPQRIYFLHEELTRLPAFPRKALEACFGMYNGQWGKELHGVDVMHKLAWAQLVTTMLRGMENPYLFGDLHLFINVINGVMILHCEDSSILRHCMATYIEIAFRFKAMFSTNGFFLIMPTILRCYSNYQTNIMLCEVLEFTCKQFYIMHRKPFILQMFGAIANMLDTCDNEQIFDPMLVKSVHLYQLLNAMQNLDNFRDNLEILSLVHAEKPLKALDLCYRDDPLAFCILTDAIASCVTICAYAPESRRSYQMLLVVQAILPHYLRQLQDDTRKSCNNPSALKHELHSLTTLIVEMKALIGCCDILARNFSGPQKSFDIVSMGGRGRSIVCESPQVFEPGEESIVVRAEPTKKAAAAAAAAWEASDDTEVQREMFRRPRDALLVLAAIFLKHVTPRVRELAKAVPDHGKVPDTLDQKYHMKLSEVAHSLLKLAPYDPNALSCEGLQRYFLDILPVTDWAVEQNRSALNFILRRLDKTFSKIVKKNSIRRRINWDALSNWLTGLYQTLQNFPYMAHLHFLKTTVQVCLKIVIGDPVALGGGDESSSSVAHSAPATVLSSFSPPQNFCSAVMKLTCILMQTLGEQSFPLEYVCSLETLGSMSERIEPVLCHVIIPLFLRVGTGAKDAPQLRQKDLNYSLNLMLNAINPLVVKATLGPTTSLAAAIISRPPESGRQGSVSVQDRQVTASNAPKFVRDSVYQSVFLAVKVMCLSFEKKLNFEWVKMARVTKELGSKRAGGASFWNFLEFALTARTPLNVLLRPFVEHKLLMMKPQSDIEGQWHEIIREKLTCQTVLVGRSNGAWLMELATELKNLKEDLCNKPLEGVQSRTPTILADLHSDSSSMQSAGRRQSDPRRASSDNRRLSTSASSKVSRLSPSPLARQGLSPQESIQSPIEDTTIVEETETEGGPVFAGESDTVPTHFPRHKTTLRLSNRGSRRRTRRSLYRSRGDDDGTQLTDLAESASETFEMKPVINVIDVPTQSSSRPRLSLSQRTQSLDQPTTVRVTSEFGETTSEYSIPKRQGAFRGRSHSQSPLDTVPTVSAASSGQQLTEQRHSSIPSESSGQSGPSSARSQTKFV